MNDLSAFSAPSFRLDGRRALITGAGRGIGHAIAAAYAHAGAEVTLCARTATEVEASAQELRRAGFLAQSMVGDVTDVASFGALVAQQGPFDILVNNAGTNRPRPIHEITPDDYDAVMNVNLRAAYFAAQAVTSGMIKAGRGGVVINMSSQMGHVGAPNRTLYCASKWAIEGFTKALAAELGPQNIRVNSICPTFVDTPMTKPMFEDPAFKASVLSQIKLGRIAQVSDITGAAVFLASDAAAMMTGSSLVVDGGWTAV